LHKIGFTRRAIEKRLKEFKTGNASELYLVDSFASEWGVKVEYNLHKIFKKKSIRGEWFDLSEDEVNKFKEYCINIHNNLKFIAENSTYYLENGKF
jgi:hypothetical protein